MTTCPVCLHSADDDDTHCRCGWQLRGGPALGWAGDELRAEFARRYDAAARDWDLAAAVRSGATHDHAQTLGLRGGAPSGAAFAAARTRFAVNGTATTFNGALVGLLTDLARRVIPAVQVVGVSADHIAAQRLVADRIGLPQPDGPVRTVEWSTAGIASASVARRFQLAGGVGATPVDRAVFDRAVEQGLTRLSEAGADCIVVAPPPGWALLDRALEILRRSLQVRVAIAGDPTSLGLGAIVATVLRTAPLPCDYAVLLQRLDPATGVIDFVSQRLFATGTRLASDESFPSLVVPVYGSPVGHPAAAIPVVARIGANLANWPVLAMEHTDLPARSVVHVRFTLDTPEQVRITREDGQPVMGGDRTRLLTIIETVPERVPVHGPLDLVCAVELCGTIDEVRRRIQFADRLIELVSVSHLRPNDVRFEVIGYLDHRDRPTEMYPANTVVLGGTKLGSAARARAILKTWGPYPPRSGDAATAMEDALSTITDLRWNPSTQAARVLVLLGWRPPCVDIRRGDPIPGCAEQLDWRDSARRLRQRSVRILGIRTPGNVLLDRSARGAEIRAYAEQTWRELAGRDLFGVDQATPDAVCGLVTGRPSVEQKTFPLCLAAPVGAARHSGRRARNSGERTTR